MVTHLAMVHVGDGGVVKDAWADEGHAYGTRLVFQ
jgi:hypothetical protein